MNKLWSGRFSKNTDKLMESFNASLAFDKRLYQEDIDGSLAHAEMLSQVGILEKEDYKKISMGLKEIAKEIEAGKFDFSNSDEDIHMAIEKRLTDMIGEAGGRLHTARSRNDQVATDLRLYLKKVISAQKDQLLKLLSGFYELANKHRKTSLPGMTHLQSAQPISFSFYCMAYFFMFKRDFERLGECYDRVDTSPLGSGAFAGVNYPIDRKMTQKILGFSKLGENAMDNVADRDFVMEYSATASIISMHLSRINEEFILWSTDLIDFIEMDDAFSTGSSIMPNKKNPDACELIRGKTGRIYGNFVGIATVLKSLPLAYNKDLQEDKEALFDTADQLSACLEVFTRLLATIKINEKNMRAACEKGYLQATDVADYLVLKKMPFRDAHRVSGELVKYLEEKNMTYEDLQLQEFKQFSDLFENDIKETIKLENVVNNKKSYGSTSFESVGQQLKIAKSFLDKHA